MLRLEWTEPAAQALEQAQTYYHELNPAAARLLAARIVQSARRLRQHPEIGRAGMIGGTREWSVSRTPYLLVYRVVRDRIEILAVWRSAQDRTDADD